MSDITQFLSAIISTNIGRLVCMFYIGLMLLLVLVIFRYRRELRSVTSDSPLISNMLKMFGNAIKAKYPNKATLTICDLSKLSDIEGDDYNVSVVLTKVYNKEAVKEIEDAEESINLKLIERFCKEVTESKIQPKQIVGSCIKHNEETQEHAVCVIFK